LDDGLPALEIACPAEVAVRALSILYHDVVHENFEESGFPGAAAARYKFTETEFEAHLRRMAERAPSDAVSVDRWFAGSATGQRPFFMTLDDGGSSAVYIAEALERRNWRGHFFVTTNYIDTPTFVARDQIRWLRQRGHVVGSHSSSHPFRMSEIPSEQLAAEWKDSVAVLSEILGEPVRSASVPGGFYAPRVAEAAAAAGVRALFTSEPTTRVAEVAGCLVLGRYTVYRGLSSEYAGELAAGSRLALTKQQLLWGVKKILKTAAAPLWDGARKVLFSGK
jgi:peptidoglycan/xylan/chitin deacetylase (PgdA/CDA1 family)